LGGYADWNCYFGHGVIPRLWHSLVSRAAWA